MVAYFFLSLYKKEISKIAPDYFFHTFSYKLGTSYFLFTGLTTLLDLSHG